MDDAVLTVGSSSAIFAHQAARLGLRVAFAGKVGPDVFGELATSFQESSAAGTLATEGE